MQEIVNGARAVIRSPWRQVSCIVLVLIGFAFYWTAPDVGLWALFTFSLLGSIVTFWEGLRALFVDRHISIDTFNAFALGAAFGVQEITSAAFIVLMLQSASILEWRTSAKSRRATEKLLALRPDKALRERGDALEEIPASEVRSGDILVVRQGERVPVDGEIVEGRVSMDESSVTGESAPVDKAPGDEVLSITVALSGQFRMRATRVGEDSTVEKMARLIREAEQNKSKTHKMADRFAQIFLPAVLVGGIGIYLVTGNLDMLIAFFLVACADDIAVSIPLALTGALGLAAKKGIIVKGGKYLEAIARAKTIVLDKTGTLTYGNFSVRAAHLEPGMDENLFWRMLAGAEKMSGHPIGKAVYHFAVKKTDRVPQARDFTIHDGAGVSATMDGHEIAIGNEKIGGACGFSVGEEALQKFDAEKRSHGQTTFLVYLDGIFSGIVTVADTPKKEAKSSIAQLYREGVRRVSMLTGDNKQAAGDVSRQLGITDFRASLLPEDKVRAVREYLKDGGVAMVGDGINDAPVLAQASVGVAMGSRGTAVAIESADIVILEDDLSRLPFLVRLGKRTLSVTRWNIGIWVVTNLLGFALVLMGVLDPVLAAAYNFATDFLPLINSIRLFKDEKA